MGWGIALGIIVLLAILPLGVSVCYDSSGPLVFVTAGPIRLQIVPAKKKKNAASPEKAKKAKKDKEKTGKKVTAEEAAPKTERTQAAPQTPEKPAPKEEKGGSITDFLPLVGMVFDFLVDFRRKFRVKCLYLNLILAGDDPCDLAVNYGKACAAVGNLWPRLEEWFVIRKRDVQIQCDFEATQTLITARLDVSITLGRLIGVVIWHGVKILVKLLSILNKRKGGAAA